MTISRRDFTKGTVAAAAIGGALTSRAALAQGQELVFTSWGGAYQEAIRKAWLEPFSKSSGVRIKEDTNPEIARIKAMVDTNTVTWDVVTGGGATLMQGVDAGLFEPIPADKVEQSHVFPDTRYEFGVPSEIFSTVFAFSTKTYPDGKPQPKTWADFFDTKQFPGKRSMYGRPQSTIEAALLADGVAPADVYKVLSTKDGVDRAFKMLAAIKPHAVQWWTNGAHPVQVLGSGDAVMSMGWNGRYQAGINEGLPLKMIFAGQVAQLGFFMVVKGAKNKENAYKFLNWMVSAKAQAEFHKYIMYGPVTAKAYDGIPKDKWANLPGSPDAKIDLFLDIAWWRKNGQAMVERYQVLTQG